MSIPDQKAMMKVMSDIFPITISLIVSSPGGHGIVATIVD